MRLPAGPSPGGKSHALLGHSSYWEGWRYQFLEAIGDNVFQVTEVLQASTGGFGATPAGVVDSDCDGLDELGTNFYPLQYLWEWEVSSASFDSRCMWEFDNVGTFTRWTSLDVDQNGVPEIAALNHDYLLRVYPNMPCNGCDSLGGCSLLPPPCFCPCGNDPLCDGAVSDVADVVKTIDVAFRGSAANIDIDCPFARSDVNRSGATDVSDVIHVIDVAFRGNAPSASYQPPCP